MRFLLSNAKYLIITSCALMVRLLPSRLVAAVLNRLPREKLHSIIWVVAKTKRKQSHFELFEVFLSVLPIRSVVREFGSKSSAHIAKTISVKDASAFLMRFSDEWLSSVIFRFPPQRLVDVIRGLPVRRVIELRSDLVLKNKLDYEKHEIWLGAESTIEYNTRSRSCSKEPETVDWIESYFEKNDVFYDIGANVGAYSLIAAKYWQGGVKVVSIEPSLTSFPQLCRNISENRCDDIISPIPLALSKRTGVSRFEYSTLRTGSAQHSLLEGPGTRHQKDSDEEAGSSEGGHDVVCFALDDLVRTVSLPRPSHIKIDVDGAEGLILDGSSDILSDPSLKTMMIEIDPSATSDVERISRSLEEAGLRFEQSFPHTERAANYLFVRKAG